MKHVFVLVLFSISGYCIAGTNFPSCIPNDFKIEYSYHGGERQLTHNITLQFGDCTEARDDYYYNHHSAGNFKISKKQKGKFNDLYQSLKSLNAFTLTNGDTYIMDIGFTYIKYTINGKIYTVSGYDDYSNWKDGAAFQKVVTLISTFTAEFSNIMEDDLEKMDPYL